MLWKNYPTTYLFTKLPVRFALDIVAAWKALISGNPKEFLAIAKAHLHFIAQINKMYQKRKKSTLPRPSQLAGQYNFMLIWNYFFKGKRNLNELPINES